MNLTTSAKQGELSKKITAEVDKSIFSAYSSRMGIIVSGLKFLTLIGQY